MMTRLKSRYPILLILAMAAVLVSFAAGPLYADEVINGNCLDTVSGGSQNCTANDGPGFTLGITNISDITSGCINNTSIATLVKFQLTLQLVNGSERYDVGTWINSNGTSAQSGANGTCSRFGLFPAGTQSPPGTTTCPPWDMDSGSGPYVNLDGDSCGDIRDKDKFGCNQNSSGSPWDDTVYNTLTPSGITVLCSDPAATGFVRVPTCNTWSQNPNVVDDPADAGSSCDSAAEFGLGTTAKCNCSNEDTNVPAPNLGLTCTCSPSTVRVGFQNGASTSCTVTFNNAINCTPDTSTAENLRCGTAAYIQFQVDENTSGTGGDIGQFLTSLPTTPTETTSGALPTATTTQVRWTPRNQITSGSLGIIGDNQTGSMTFQYYVAPTTGTLTNRVIADVSTYFSNAAPAANGSYTSRVLTNGTAQCIISTSPNATWAHVSSFAAREDDGRVAVEWETAGEVGTVAFEVERKDPASGRFVKITEQAVPAVAQLPGGRYRLVDETAPRGQKLTYRLIEIDQNGKRETFGPYRVAVQAEGRRPSQDDRDFTAQIKAVSPRLLKGAVEQRTAGRAAAAVAGEKAQKASRAKIEVSGSGMVRVAMQDITSGLGMPAGEAAAQVRGGKLQLTHGGQNVAWEAAADGNGLVFYAEAIQSPYTNTNVYWLDRGKGQTMTTVAGRPTSGPAAGEFVDTLHVETDAIPAVTAPLPVEDFWIWKSFFAGFPGFESGTFAANVPAPGSGEATLAVNIYGFSSVQRASLKVNGSAIGEVAWEGTGPRTATVSVPAGVLQNGNNLIEMVAVAGELGFWFDSFDITYPHRYRAVADRLAFRAAADQAVALSGFQSSGVAVYDVAQPLAPRRLSGLAAQPQPDGTWGVSFLAPGAGPFVALTTGGLGGATVRASAPADLRNPSRGAEYLVITPDALNGESQRLAGLRAAQGLSTMVVDLDDVMDVFNDGIYSPLAIRSFLAHAVASWPTPPRYVALAGKGTYDYRNLMGLSSNLLPPIVVTMENGLAPADAEFGDFDGNGVPEVAIGRIPAVTAEEMRGYVDKVAAYESAAGGSWTGQALFVADDPDAAGDFHQSSETLVTSLSSGLNLSRIYLPAAPTSAQIQASRQELLNALGSGQVLFNYIGHGGLDRLASEGLLLTSDVPQLGNTPRLPVMTALTCLISQFAYPQVSSIGEEIVLQRDGGAAALFGPTWLSFNSLAGELGTRLLPQLSAAGGGRLGDRVLRGLAAYAAAGGDRQTLRVYTLLGDPALALKR